jgi:hypothetical protein
MEDGKIKIVVFLQQKVLLAAWSLSFPSVTLKKDYKYTQFKMSETPDLSSHNFYKPFTSSIAGFIVPMSTGLLSASSSGLIIYIISKSQQKLSTTYHRIMAFMSAFDIISSVFIALGTIMMPSDNIYKLGGPMLGNKITCQIQGWLVLFGIAGSASLNACLAWYFPLKIAFKMDSSTISVTVLSPSCIPTRGSFHFSYPVSIFPKTC